MLHNSGVDEMAEELNWRKNTGNSTLHYEVQSPSELPVEGRYNSELQDDEICMIWYSGKKAPLTGKSIGRVLFLRPGFTNERYPGLRG